MKEYDAFAQEKASEVSFAVLQELVEKEKAADDIMHSLNTHFTILAKNIRLPEHQQSVPGRDTGESQGPVGAHTLMVLKVDNSMDLWEFVSGVTTQNSLRGVGVESKSSCCNKPTA